MARTDDTITHLIAQMGLRAPRVALLVPGAGDWHLMARNGIHAITQMWGGAGWLVIPVASTDVHPVLLAALREYDPDYVAIPAANSFVARADYDLLHDAQEAISAACANYRSPIATSVASPDVGDIWEPYFSTMGSGLLTILSDVVDPSIGQTIGASPAIGGPVSLSAAAKFGMSEPPTQPIANIDVQLRNRAVVHLLSDSSNPMNLSSLLGVTTRDRAQGDFTTDLSRTTFGLSSVFEHGPENRPPALVVCGASPSDFALAMVWDRTYGYGVWLPDEWWDDKTVRPQVIMGINSLAQKAFHPLGRELVFTSTSLGRAQLVERLNECNAGSERMLGEPLLRSPDETIIHPAESIRFPRYHKRWLRNRPQQCFPMVGRRPRKGWNGRVCHASASTRYSRSGTERD
jgi:hypothetical protein